MRKKVKRKTILIDGIRYYDDKPDTCRKCFFWKNRKVGCVLGTQNRYYLAEAVKTEQEKKSQKMRLPHLTWLTLRKLRRKSSLTM